MKEAEGKKMVGEDYLETLKDVNILLLETLLSK